MIIMEKNKLYFSLYSKNELENDIEILGTFDNIKELQRYFKVSKGYLYKLGIQKRKHLKINVKIGNTEYTIIVDKD